MVRSLRRAKYFPLLFLRLSDPVLFCIEHVVSAQYSTQEREMPLSRSCRPALLDRCLIRARKLRVILSNGPSPKGYCWRIRIADVNLGAVYIILISKAEFANNIFCK